MYISFVYSNVEAVVTIGFDIPKRAVPLNDMDRIFKFFCA